MKMQSNKEAELQSKKGYHKLLLWQKGRALIVLLYERTESFPRSEVLGLQSQIRRAMISFVLNIVEGHRRNSRKEFLKFLNIADASLTEVEACLEIAVALQFLSIKDYDELETKRKELASMMSAFIRRVKESL